RVGVPNAACSQFLHYVSPAIAIATDSPVRMVEATWNGTPLTLIDPGQSEVTETPHSYGEQIPFFKPVFVLDGVSPGAGTLEIRALAQPRTLPPTQQTAGPAAAAPPPVSSCLFAAAPHPRAYLTPSRLARARARGATDPAAMRWHDGVQYFLNEFAVNSDPE